jgi:hypothetical protein
VKGQGLPIRYIENERIALDIDDPKDFDRLLSCEPDEGESIRLARMLSSEQNAQGVRRSGAV